MTIYTMTKNTIIRQKKAGKLDKAAWQAKLDVFLMFDRITPEQYTELKGLIGDEPLAKEHSGTKQ